MCDGCASTDITDSPSISISLDCLKLRKHMSLQVFGVLVAVAGGSTTVHISNSGVAMQNFQGCKHSDALSPWTRQCCLKPSLAWPCLCENVQFIDKGQAIQRPFQAWLGLLDGNGIREHTPCRSASRSHRKSACRRAETEIRTPDLPIHTGQA